MYVPSVLFLSFTYFVLYIYCGSVVCGWHVLLIPVVCASTSQVPAQRTYYLCGWSSGGKVAFEMARRLRSKGEVQIVIE